MSQRKSTTNKVNGKMLGAIRNKRSFLAHAFGRLGMLRLLEETIVKRRPGLIVLTYHRIAVPDVDPFYDPVISATPEVFRTQVRWLNDRVRILTLNEAIDQIESDSPWSEPSMLLTFDDGYRDNFDLAKPILAERNVPATFFIASAFLEMSRLPWWDHVAYVLKQTQVPQFSVERQPDGNAPSIEIDLEAMTRRTAIMMVIRAFLDDTIANERWFLDHLAARARVEIDSEALGRKLFMDWAQVRQLADSGKGLSIGSHAHTHRKLAALDDDSQDAELIESKQILETQLGRPIKALAYPFGWPGTYTTRTKVLAARAGYQVAFSSQEGINRPHSVDRYEVRRLGVGSADSAELLRARSTLHAAFGNSFL